MDKTIKEGSSVQEDNIVAQLQNIQHRHGYLPQESLKRLSKQKGLFGVDLYGVATFYSQFKLERPAQHTISVCDGTACHVKDSISLLEEIKKELDIEPEETDEEGVFSLQVVRCLGLCASAPVVKVDDDIYSKVKKEDLKEILNSYRNKTKRNKTNTAIKKK